MFWSFIIKDADAADAAADLLLAKSVTPTGVGVATELVFRLDLSAICLKFMAGLNEIFLASCVHHNATVCVCVCVRLLNYI